MWGRPGFDQEGLSDRFVPGLVSWPCKKETKKITAA